MAKTTILVVDDIELVRVSLGLVLEKNGFDVTCAGNVVEALHFINEKPFDVLLSDLQMPDPGDGLTVVSAMRHANPNAVTLLLSAFPHMSMAANAILMQADEILVKPIKIPHLMEMIHERISKGPLHRRVIESVASILERTAPATIEEWYALVQLEPSVLAVTLPETLRCAHLPQLFKEVVLRLQNVKPLGTREPQSPAAALHGRLRQHQGYSASMLVEESRMLQVSIFNTLQNNLASIDFSILLISVMTIADEVDHQLSQAMTAFSAESTVAA